MRHFLTVPLFLSLTLLPLTACGKTSDSTAADTKTEHSADDGHDHSKDKKTHSKGGQVVESDPYHIELVTNPQDNETQLNLHLLHEVEDRVITDAQVTANVRQPDGEQQTIKLVYEPTQKSYIGVLTTQTAGQYDLVVQTDIGGEKINSRFNIKK
ncbi:hypothetical protein IQ266_11960 [filamentous cyanobacterium LEGE 11480]|uniref:YtkA-like domain-containing protein n=1 Tax=Romeriopsis navalis LEGE 11480 TaxID=2777977 RepID=A0A928VPE3_9CYAN|nr:hypothetical protein [Romeriopsis navalis]MBE9030446.1 hypothetical protein [Romeriopsis navalis LEGE 11480]